ncbi:zinc finger protein 135-like [Trichomycterus rosablanca]|uniref:zinc finger protein 135-like n=1 Tax=Trichomycterus rosablanca TaxID=2290929 RepID=UPI002F35E205
MNSLSTMEDVEFLNSLFTERLLVVAGEIFQAVKDLIIKYQEQTECTKQENIYLRKMLTAQHFHNAQDQTTQAFSQELPNITHEALEINSSVIQVKVEDSTMHQNIKPQQSLNNPSVCTSSSAVTAPCDFSEQPTSDGINNNCLDNKPAMLIKSEPCNSQIISEISSPVVQAASGTTENHLKDLRDNHDSNLSSKCQMINDSLQSQTSESVCYCEYCGKPFQHRADLKMHLVVHEKERPRPYRCDLCEKSYSYAQVLEVHRRTHTGERPYQCRFCGKRFNQKGHCKDHEKIHTGEKPFSCSICGKRFIHSSQVKKHIIHNHPSVKLS